MKFCTYNRGDYNGQPCHLLTIFMVSDETKLGSSSCFTPASVMVTNAKQFLLLGDKQAGRD